MKKSPWNKGKKGVQTAWNKGLKFSAQSKAKMSLAHKGQKAWNKGLTLSAEYRKKISDGTKQGMKKEGISEKLRQSKLGTKQSKETVQKRRMKMMGHIVSDEARALISKANTGRPKSKETLLKMSLAMRGKRSGKDSPLWKGGVTPLNEKIRKSPEYKIWRKSVFERDNYTCVWCKARASKGVQVVLNADHIKPFALFPELRFAIDNGRTLCVPCHLTTDTWGSKTRLKK